MLTALLSFFTSNIGKYVGYLLIAVVIALLAYGYVKSKENTAVEAATAAYNAKQLQASLLQSNIYQQEVADLNNYIQSLTSQITTLQQTIESKTQKAQTVIENSTNGKTLDPIFNETLRSLK